MSEQRNTDRLPLTMNVQLIARGINRRSCLLKDISPGGALLEMREKAAATERALERNDVILIRMFMGEGRDIRQHELRARIAHAEAGLCGVTFFNPDDETLQALLKMADRQPLLNASMTAEAGALIEKLGHVVLGYCRNRLPELFRLAEDGFLDASEHARTNADQRLLFDAVSQMRKQQATVRTRFLTELEESFTRLDTAARKASQRPDVSGLALVDKEQFEEWLVVKVMASRADVACRSQLFALQARLDELSGSGPGQQVNPFAPVAICESFKDAIAILRPVGIVEKVLYKAFEDSLLKELEGLYESLNNELVEHNVLPQLDLTRYVHHHEDDEAALDALEQDELAEGEEEAAPASAAGKAVARGHASGKTNGSAPAAPQAPARGGQNGSAGVAGSAVATGAAGNGISRADGTIADQADRTIPGISAARLQAPRSAAEFMERANISPASERFQASQRDAQAAVSALRRLFEMQHSRRSGEEHRVSVAKAVATGAPVPPPPAPVDYFELKDVQDSFPKLKSAGTGWKQALESEAAAKGTELAGTVLSVVQMTESLLKTLGQNQIIGDQAKGWFHKLELPLLHSLMNDDDLFQRDDHPARQVLNRLARLGFKDHPLTREQEAGINALVDNIAKGFDSDPRVFNRALDELDPMVKRQDLAYQRNLERVRQLAEGEHRLESARHRVQETLDDKLAGKKVPKPVLTLLEAGWRDLLVKTHLRQGEDSKGWREFTGLLDELLAIGADVRRNFDLRELLKLIKNGLQEVVEINGRQQQQAITELKHLLAGTQRLLGDVAWEQVPVQKVETDPDEERWLDKWVERARRLQLGDWMELRHRGSEAERMRLAWRSSDSARFVFVNHQGIKVNDFTLRELAALMHTGNALIFEGDDVPVVDDALERVVHQLYDQLAFQSMHDELTGLVNRAEFTRQLQRVVDAAKRQRSRHVLCYLNLDQFKLINNTSGFAAGDQLLKEVANLLGKALKAKTRVARLNADEFGLLLEDCDLGKAQQLISLRLGELAAMKFNWESQSYRLTASAGLVDITYTSENDAHILRSAEEACAQAKKDGGNRIQIYQPNDDDLSRRDNVMVWVAKLNQALEEERLTLRCQKIEAISPRRKQDELPHYEIL
ncbi:MAG: DUF1631 family protein, partial [Moraxellaceae bacterium]|nr:DUF1631 family protein [Moraxellaceae bacterium]